MNHRKLSKDWWNLYADKPVVVMMFITHLFLLCNFFPQFFSWSGVCLFFALYFMSGCFGITLCYHRLLTHKSFKTYPMVRFFLLFCGCLAVQGSPVIWVGSHRHHHKESDTEDDLHSPIHGVMWSHMFWVLTKIPEGFHPEDLAVDLRRDKMVMWFHRFWWLPQIIVSGALIIGGLFFGDWNLAISWFLWGGINRTVAVFHATWFVNSATHIWGYKNFHDTGDHSRNNWWVALLSFGEGWHNNHHADERSAAHGMRWYEFDLTYQIIRLMELVGLAWDVRRPKVIP